MGGRSGKGQSKLWNKAHKGSSKRPAQQAPPQGGTDAALQWLCGAPSKEPRSAGEPV